MSVLVIAGPSGAGKTTLQRAVIARLGGVARQAITHTTRAPRPNEVDGVDYHFVTPEAFDRLVATGVFLEHVVYQGNRYGGSSAAVAAAATGGVCVQVLDPQGCDNYRVLAGRFRLLYVFVDAPRAALIERMTAAGRADLASRIDNIDEVVAYGRASSFDEWLVNEDLDATTERLVEIVRGAHRAASLARN